MFLFTFGPQLRSFARNIWDYGRATSKKCRFSVVNRCKYRANSHHQNETNQLGTKCSFVKNIIVSEKKVIMKRTRIQNSVGTTKLWERTCDVTDIRFEVQGLIRQKARLHVSLSNVD